MRTRHGPRWRFGRALLLLCIAVVLQLVRSLFTAEQTTAAQEVSRSAAAERRAALNGRHARPATTKAVLGS